MSQNSGVMLPKNLTDLINQRDRVWVEHDQANQAQSQLEQLAPKVAAGESTDTVAALSQSGEPPDEVAASVKSLSHEIDAVNRLRTELQAAEQNRIIGISMAVVGVILAIVLAVVMIRMR